MMTSVMQEPSLAKWLRWGVYAAALVPLIIFAQYMSPFHFGKVIVFRALVQAMAAGYILLAWRRPEYRPKSHPFTWAFLAFALVFTVTTLTSVAPLQSWWGTLERMGGLFTFWHYFAFYLISLSVLRTREHWRTLLDLVVAVGVVSAIYGFLQKTSIDFILGSGGRARPFGTIGNAALFAGYQILVAWFAATSLFFKTTGPAAPAPQRAVERGGILIGVGLLTTLLIALLFNGQGWWIIPVGVVLYGIYLVCAGLGAARKFYMIAAILMTVAAVMTAVRGSLLAIAVSVVVFALLWSAFSGSRKARNALVGLLAAGAVFVFLAMMLQDTPLVRNSRYLSRVTDFSSQTRTVQTRLWTWTSGLQGWAQNTKTIVLGYGPENFNVPFSEFFNPLHFNGPGAETFFDRAHNNFVEALVTMGIIGLIAYLTLFGVLFRMFVQLMKRGGDDRALGIGFTAMVVAYMIHNSFIFDTSANFLTFFMLAGFAVAVHQGLGELPTNKQLTRRLTAGQSSAAIVLSLAAILLIWNTSVMPARANYTSTRAVIASWEGDALTTIEKYKEAIAYDTPGRYEFRHKFAQYILEISNASNIGEFQQFPQAAEQAIDAVEMNVEENPSDYLPLLYLARLHIILGKNNPASEHNDIAIKYVERALDITPTFVRAYYEIAQGYLNKQEREPALEWFLKAAELQPEVGLSWWYVATTRAELAEEQQEIAGVREALTYVQKALENNYRLDENDLERVAAMYAIVGDERGLAGAQERGVIGVLERMAELDPNGALIHARLATAYAEVGLTEDAISLLRHAATLAPRDAKFQEEIRLALEALGVTP